VVIVLAAWAAYSNSFHGPLIFDDEGSITKNSTIKKLWPIWPLFCPPNGETVMDRPMLNFSLAINYAISGEDVWSYHVGNLVIHCCNALLLLGVLRRTFLLPSMRDRWQGTAFPLAFVTALLWAVHPLGTESVTYIVQRAESLMAFFYLLTLYNFIRAVTAAGKAAMAWYVATALSCIAGVTSKEVMASAPLITFVYDYAFITGSFRESARRRWPLYAVMLSTWLLLAWLVTIGAGSLGVGVGMSWWAYFCTQLGAIVHYLRLCIVPYPLNFDYGDYLATGFWEIVLPGIFMLSLGIATVVALWRWPKIGLLGLAFFAILSPTSSFLPACVTQTMAEHRMYLPLALVLPALTTAVCAGGQELVRRKKVTARAAAAAGMALSLLVAAIFGVMTFQRNKDYRDTLSIWQDSIIKMPENHRPQLNLGSALMDLNRFDEAVEHFWKALELRPNSVDAHYDIGTALAEQNKLDEAIDHFREALRLDNSHVLARYNLAVNLANVGKIDEAIQHYETLLSHDTTPRHADAHFNLANLLRDRGRYADAISHFRDAIELQPDGTDAMVNLAVLLTSCPDQSLRNPAEAIELAQRAVNLSKEDNPLFLGSLAAAYAASNRYPDAVALARKAYLLAQQQDKPDVAKAIEPKIAEYEAGAAKRP
jgi:tetratricopeptide (TPR) repeat protein